MLRSHRAAAHVPAYHCRAAARRQPACFLVGVPLRSTAAAGRTLQSRGRLGATARMAAAAFTALAVGYVPYTAFPKGGTWTADPGVRRTYAPPPAITSAASAVAPMLHTSSHHRTLRRFAPPLLLPPRAPFYPALVSRCLHVMLHTSASTPAGQRQPSNLLVKRDWTVKVRQAVGRAPAGSCACGLCGARCAGLLAAGRSLPRARA